MDVNEFLMWWAFLCMITIAIILIWVYNYDSKLSTVEYLYKHTKIMMHIIKQVFRQIIGG